MNGSASRLAPLAYGYQYRDMTGFTSVTRWLLYALAAITALWLADWAFGYEPFADRHAEVTALESALGIGRGLAWLVCAIVVLRWIHRANVNARALGARDLAASPGMSVGWFFVPIANLWMPFQAMRQLWKASAKPGDREAADTSALLGWWWLFWLGWQVATVAAIVLTGQGRSRGALDPEGTQGLLQLADKVTALSHLFTVFAALLLATIVARIHAMQTGPRDSSAAFAARDIGPPSETPSVADAPARPEFRTAAASGKADYEARFSILGGWWKLILGLFLLVALITAGLPVEEEGPVFWVVLVIGGLGFLFGLLLVFIGGRALIDRSVQLRLDDRGLFWKTGELDKSSRRLEWEDLLSARIHHGGKGSRSLVLTTSGEGERRTEHIDLSWLGASDRDLLAALARRGVSID